MASGFIDIDKENTFSIRWTGFDEVIKIIIKELHELKSTKLVPELINELQSNIPPSHLEEGLEMGWGFIDERINGTTTRSIELNKFNEKWIEIFWEATENEYKKLMKNGTKYSNLHPDYLKELIGFKANKVQNPLLHN